MPPIAPKPTTDTSYRLDVGLFGLVGAAYGLGGVPKLRPVMLDGVTASLIEIRSETSLKMAVEYDGVLLFVKQVPWYCSSSDAVSFSIQAELAAQRTGVPTATLAFPVYSAEPWFEHNGHKFVVHHLVDGRRYSGAAAEQASAMSELSALHAAAPPEGDPGKSTSPFEVALDHARLLVRLRGSASQPSVVEDAISGFSDDAARAGFASLPHVLVHGDFNPWNVVWHRRTAEVAALVDFDNATRGARIWDLAEALLTFGALSYEGDSTNFSSRVPEPLAPGRAAELIAWYERGRSGPLIDVERACLPSVLGAVGLELVALGLIREDWDAQQESALISWAAANAAALAT